MPRSALDPELRQALPDLQQGLLRRVFGQFAVAAISVRHRLQPSSVDDDKGGERLLISSLSRHHELGIHPSPHGAPVSAGVTSVGKVARSRHFFNFVGQLAGRQRRAIDRAAAEVALRALTAGAIAR